MTGRDNVRENAHLLLSSAATALLLLLSMPGRFGWWPLLFVALVPLLFVAVTKGPRQSVSAGLLAGFFYQAGMLYWIVIVLGRYGGLPPGLSVPAMLLLSVYMGMYMALFAGLFSGLVSRWNNTPGAVPSFFAAPLLWVGLDWLRSFLFSGFPWMDLGYGLYSRPILLQVADLGGHHLVTFLLVLGNVLILAVVELFRRGGPGERGRVLRVAIIPVCCLFILAAGYSGLRYRKLSQVAEEAPVLEVAVVQGNIPQDEKWTPARKLSTLDVYRHLSEKALAAAGATLVVWPETALPFFPVNDPLFEKVKRWAAVNNLWLLTGAPYFVIREDLERTFPNAVSYYNSGLLVNPAGKVAGRYDKQHLVPFGEYVPLRKLLPFLEPLVESVGNFTPGRSAAPLVMDNVKLGVLICFESIFSGLARREVEEGANVLVNLTNDAWYGRSSAPRQSFAMAVLRAVETRRSLVRAANTGVSGFVDPLGRIVRQSPIFEPLELVAKVPVLEERTIFVRFGHLFAPACLAIFLLVFVLPPGKE